MGRPAGRRRKNRRPPLQADDRRDIIKSHTKGRKSCARSRPHTLPFCSIRLANPVVACQSIAPTLRCLAVDILFLTPARLPILCTSHSISLFRSLRDIRYGMALQCRQTSSYPVTYPDVPTTTHLRHSPSHLAPNVLDIVITCLRPHVHPPSDIMSALGYIFRLRPYLPESTVSRPINCS